MTHSAHILRLNASFTSRTRLWGHELFSQSTETVKQNHQPHSITPRSALSLSHLSLKHPWRGENTQTRGGVREIGDVRRRVGVCRGRDESGGS